MKKSFVVFTLLLLSFFGFSQARVAGLLCNNLNNPIEVGVSPQFSWQISSPKRNILQTAYEIKVLSNESVVWNPGKVQSDQSVHVPYAGSPLQSGKKYSWQVRVWDNNGKASSWSAPAFFSNGIIR